MMTPVSRLRIKSLFVIISLSLILMSFTSSTKTYWYCVSSEKDGMFKMKVEYRAIDMGKEAGKAIVLNKARDLLKPPISISSFEPKKCGNCKTLDGVAINRNIDGRLVETIISGDISGIPGSGAAMIDAVGHEVKEVIHKPINIVKKPAKEFKRFFKKVF